MKLLYKRLSYVQLGLTTLRYATEPRPNKGREPRACGAWLRPGKVREPTDDRSSRVLLHTVPAGTAADDYDAARGPTWPHTAQKTAAGSAETAYAKPLSTACKFNARPEVCKSQRRSRRRLPQTSAQSYKTRAGHCPTGCVHTCRSCALCRAVPCRRHPLRPSGLALPGGRCRTQPLPEGQAAWRRRASRLRRTRPRSPG